MYEFGHKNDSISLLVPPFISFFFFPSVSVVFHFLITHHPLMMSRVTLAMQLLSFLIPHLIFNAFTYHYLVRNSSPFFHS